MTRAVLGRGIVTIGLVAAAGGCASVNLSAGLPEVSAAVQARGAPRIAWTSGIELDREVAERLRSLLQRKLTADDVVQIALLNSRELQAVYTELGLAQADLVQAGLFKNPMLDAAVLFPLTGARPDLQVNMVVSVLDALYVPLRKRVAAARFEEAKLRVAGAVLEHAIQVRAAYHVYQADEQMVELRRTIAQALGAALEVSRRLHDAGNISDLDLARERAQAETAKVRLRAVEVEAIQSRERLNVLMGLWGADTAWQIDGRMPAVPAGCMPTENAEREALAQSLDLAQARQRIVAAGQQLGFDRATALVPDVDPGVGAEKDGAEAWKVGPGVTVPVPIFDQGQARIARAAAELRRAQQEYYALAVRLRAAARAAHERVAGARDRAFYYQDILLPLRERIVNEGQLHYNAMQLGIVQLLRDREQQIETGAAYVEALRDYWLAATDLTSITSGRLPAAAAGRTRGSAVQTRTNGPEGH